jgi:hypothetical protein
MKIQGLFFLIMGALLLPGGCSKNESPETAAARAGVKEPEAPAALSFGYSMRIGMWLYTIDNDTGNQTDVTKAVESIPLGEKLQVLAPEPRQATNPYDSRVYNYSRVRRDTGSEGLVFANQITVGSELAVVSDEKANLYRSAKNIDASDYILPRGVVLGVFPETERDGFIRIEAYDPAAQTYRRNLFIKASAVSRKNTDVQSSILLQTAGALDPDKEKNRREALLDSALYDYPDSIFADAIRALVETNSTVPAREISARFTVNDENVNVREGPDASSRALTMLDRDIEVYAVEETVDEYEADGRRARWYRIVQPVEGWVFGAWLEEMYFEQ